MSVRAAQEPRDLVVVRHAPRGALVRGDRVRWRGRGYQVAGLDGMNVLLAEGTDGGRVSSVLLPVLAAASDFAVLDGAGVAVARAELPDFALLDGVPEWAAQAARRWELAVIEVDTGLPPGAPPGAVPRPAFDPARTTLIDRYQTKAAEMSAVLGVTVSWQTVQAKRLRYRKHRSVMALVDGRSTKARRLHGATDPLVVDQLMALVERQRRRLDTPSNARKLFKQLRRLVHAAYGPQVKVPAEQTLYKLLERLGVKARDLGAPGARTAGRTGAPPFSVTTATMPGELVQIDSTDLDVWVLGDDGRPARAELTIAVDVATRTIIAAVLRPKQPRQRRRDRGRPRQAAPPRPNGRATKAVDACELLAQAMVPAPMRPGFDAAVHASVSALPYSELVEIDPRFAHAAARPVIVPDLIVIDHGTVFAGRTFFDACAYLGISIRTARKRTGQDKAVVERTFGAIKSMFSQYVNTYTGNDPVRVRRTVDGERLWTLPELDDLLQQWIALEWQNKPHPELADPFEVYLPHRTPNEMYAACVRVDGYLPLPLTREDYLRLLPTAWVGVSDQGIHFQGRTYDRPERDPEEGLNPYRRTRSDLRGKCAGRWEMRYTPNDPSRVWLRDHRFANRWVEAVWVHQHRVGQPWTQFLWDIAAAQYLERGGSLKDEFAQQAIAEALAELLERASRGPERGGVPFVPDGYAPAPPSGPSEVFDPYGRRRAAEQSTATPDPDTAAASREDADAAAETDATAPPSRVSDPGVDGLGLDLFAWDELGPLAPDDPPAGVDGVDWGFAAVAPDPALLAWERGPQTWAEEPATAGGESLSQRYRRIEAEPDPYAEQDEFDVDL
ncbi:integrase [Streptomyces rubiginosohelvolus]|uniref:integrase n=1 Tax=Streptomyces TaxID=1883 RepID=UPI001CD781FD|nr:integrase [Streptomyces sp. 7G]MCA1271746.1 integrase [Streptomyces sp. 7G]